MWHSEFNKKIRILNTDGNNNIMIIMQYVDCTILYDYVCFFQSCSILHAWGGVGVGWDVVVC